MTTLQFIHCANAHLRLRSSGYDGKSRPELHQLEHFVNIDVHAAQRDLDAFVVSCVGEPLIYAALFVKGALTPRVLEGPVPKWKSFGTFASGTGASGKNY